MRKTKDNGPPPVSVRERIERGIEQLQPDDYDLALAAELRKALTDKQAVAVAQLLARSTSRT